MERRNAKETNVLIHLIKGRYQFKKTLRLYDAHNIIYQGLIENIPEEYKEQARRNITSGDTHCVIVKTLVKHAQ